MGQMVNCVRLKRRPRASTGSLIRASWASASLRMCRRRPGRSGCSHQTMLINEYRLSPMDPKSRSFLEEQMEKFFFGEGAEAPAGFQAGVTRSARQNLTNRRPPSL